MSGKRANTIKIIKKANSYLVLDNIKTYEYMTVESIITNTGLSRPTVLNILKDLTNKHIVKKAGFAESDVGRSPVLYALNTEEFFAIGVDIDGPPVYVAVSDLSGKLLYSKKFELDESAKIEEIRDAITKAIEDCLQALTIDHTNVLGIGLGLPASIDIVNNCALKASRLQSLENQPIAKMIYEDTKIPVLVRNDAHLIGVAEKKRLDDCKDLLCCIHRTGIGLATILNDQLYSGDTGNSGFIGHMTIDYSGKICACGKPGCLEALSSKRAIREMYFEQTGVKKGYREILALADHNDKIAINICKEAGKYFGIGLANIVKMMDVCSVVISDIRCDEKHIFFKSINKSLKDHVTTYFKKPCKLYVGKLGENELALGGCNYVIDNFLVSPELILKVESN